MQGSEAQGIISNYLGGGYASSPNVNTAGQFRNPIFDIRTQQELAGDLDPSALYPNPQIDFSVQEDETVDPCPEGYQLIDGVCQPIVEFGKSMYDEKQDRDDRDEEERDYFSIEEMKGLEDYELLDYLNSGWLKGDPYDISIGGKSLPSWLNLPFGKQNKMRRDFIISELARRGYDTTSNQGQKSLGQALSIIDNAQASNQGVMPNQVSFFTPEEINYQIQAKNEAQDIVNQGGNPYGQSFTGNAQQIHDQVVQDAIQSGGTVNPFEAQGINTSTPSTPSLPSDWADLI
jgi:hypothetical protein